ncbi:hypothetical protein GAY33_02920 [Azospirillum brasilense]|uniref:hypothetical protein n=1 Tax=Azospirillum argentinense TaxID=2970906 RepID=UPI00190AF575|nr:hypothetical protein [Azospirillum argentinense]MBK3798202.1 hypothetical protein [Azospirillum argentinense]
MTTSRPFLGETTDREKAFPDIESLELNVVQDPYEQYARQAWQREGRYTKANIPRHLACLNPRCQQGGLDLQQAVLFSSPGQHSYYCNGHEGTPKGRHKGDPCDNRFDVTLTIVRRPVGER